MSENTPTNYWNEHRKQWDALGSPLRPSPEDLTLFNAAIAGWRGQHPGKPAVAYVLGATPEFPRLDWPSGSMVYAIDSSENMLANIWPADAPFAAGTILTNWLGLPLPDASADVILGDGGFSLINWPDDYHSLFRSTARMLRPAGRMVVRFFVRPELEESPQEVLDALMSGGIGNFHIFKWRLAMALHGDGPGGIAVSDIWRFWHEQGADARQRVLTLGWKPEIVNTIEAYRNSQQRLSFPTLSRLRELIATHLLELSCIKPGYELGERCPVITLARHDAA